MRKRMKVMFTVEGEPQGKGRPRFGKHTVRTPAKTKAYEDLIKYIYKTKAKHFFEGYVNMTINCYYAIAKSNTKKVKEQKLKNILRPDKKPDIDNVLKVFGDALNGLAYKDDAQVIRTTCEKYYSDNPRVEVVIEDL